MKLILQKEVRRIIDKHLIPSLGHPFRKDRRYKEMISELMGIFTFYENEKMKGEKI